MLSNEFVQQVINELQLNSDDLLLFTPPKRSYTKYVRTIIYDMSKQQFGIFQNVIEFPENITKVKDMQKCLITYLELHPKFQDIDYRHIWIRFAHQFYMNNGKKTKIDNNDFQISHAGQIPMSFINNFPNNAPKVEEIEETDNLIMIHNEQKALMYDNDDDDIQHLIISFNKINL
ncbi:hypothetical protein M9Y10_017257 [Tritrichomonas musculus]|uniref:Initiator binding domain-containing protein n=1 Tax=Tritrichomonas musculus TaxID=1915356 RepID=A0ABR2HXF1_9EUKA